MDSQKPISRFSSIADCDNIRSSSFTRELSTQPTAYHFAVTKVFMIVMLLLNITISISYLYVKLYTNRMKIEELLLNKQYRQNLGHLLKVKRQLEAQNEVNGNDQLSHLQVPVCNWPSFYSSTKLVFFLFILTHFVIEPHEQGKRNHQYFEVMRKHSVKRNAC